MRSTLVQQAVRGYAAAASQSAGLVKPPVAVFGLGGRYASALYSAASKKNALEKVESDLLAFKKSMSTDKDLLVLCSMAPSSVKKTVSKGCLAPKGASDLTHNFLTLLNENNRLSYAPAMIDAYSEIMSAHRGEVKAHVTVARPLDSKAEATLKKTLEASLKSGQKLILTTEEKPALLGGLTVTIGEKHIDMSVATKVKHLTSSLRAAL